MAEMALESHKIDSETLEIKAGVRPGTSDRLAWIEVLASERAGGNHKLMDELVKGFLARDPEAKRLWLFEKNFSEYH